MNNKIDIEKWLEADEDELIDGNNTDSDDELENQVNNEHMSEVNNENTDTENSDYENESESNSDDTGPILRNKYFFGKDSTRWNKKAQKEILKHIGHVLII